MHFIGLHGMGQGPDENGTIPNPPPPAKAYPFEISATAVVFYAAMQRHGKSVNSELLHYPITNFESLRDVLLLSQGVHYAAKHLQARIDAESKACPGTKFVLNGFSEGAWVIDCWLHGNMPGRKGKTCSGTGDGKYWNAIAGVELYGDPQWDGNPDKGLARLFLLTALNPYVPPGDMGTRFQSLCLYRDEICGYGMSDNDFLSRVQKAMDCANKFSCVHFRYVASGLTRTGGEFLATAALR